MREITVTELAQNLPEMLDLVELKGEELVLLRNHRPIGRIIPGPLRQTALQAMADLFRTLPEAAAADWIEQSRDLGQTGSGIRRGTLDELRDPWDS